MIQKKIVVITTSVWSIYNKLLRANLILFYLLQKFKFQYYSFVKQR